MKLIAFLFLSLCYVLGLQYHTALDARLPLQGACYAVVAGLLYWCGISETVFHLKRWFKFIHRFRG